MPDLNKKKFSDYSHEDNKLCGIMLILRKC